jgi:hypothetical protein
MKTTLLKPTIIKKETKLYLSIIAAIALFVLASCETKTNDVNELTGKVFVKYSLPLSCRWIDFTQAKVVIINNSEDLKKYVECPANIPDIDFSTNSLILAGGETGSGIHNVESEILIEDKNQLAIQATVHLLITGEIDHWAVAYLTSKLSETKVDLFLTLTDN